MSSEIALNENVLETVMLGGDLSPLSTENRVLYYQRVCESLGLNPLTKPFDYMKLQNKLTLYARKDCTEQLRKIHGISIEIKAREIVEDCYVVTAMAKDAQGRCDESIGVVSIGGLKGEARANAMMKAETKAKRRITLSIAGLGMLDEHEVATIPGVIVGEEQVVSCQAPELIQPDTLAELGGFIMSQEISEGEVKKWFVTMKEKGYISTDEVNITQIPEFYARKLIAYYQKQEEAIQLSEEQNQQRDDEDE